MARSDEPATNVRVPDNPATLTVIEILVMLSCKCLRRLRGLSALPALDHQITGRLGWVPGPEL